MSELRYGIIPDESIGDYHSAPCISHSKLKFFAENFPAQYHQKYIAKSLAPEEPKEHFDIGNAVEALLCGQAAYEKLVAVNRQWADFKSIAARTWRDETRKSGMIPLSKDNDLLVHRMYDAVMRNPDAAALIGAGMPQVTFRTKGRVVDAQCRCDWYGADGTTLPSDGEDTGPYDCDLKSIESLAPSAFMDFSSQVMNLAYHRAAPWYGNVMRRVFSQISGDDEAKLPFVRRYFVVVDKKEWPSCTVFPMPQTLFDIGEYEVFGENGLFSKLIACYERNEWPDAPVRSEIAIPRWINRDSL